MAVRTTVKIDGDASSAVGEVYRLRDALRSVGVVANDFAGGAAKITFGMLGAESAVAVARMGMQSLREGVKAYVAVNDEAAEAIAALNARALESRIALGEMVLGAGNAQVIAGAFAKTMDDLSRALGDNAGAQAVVRQGLALLLDAFGAVADVAAIASLGIGTLKLAFIALGGSVEIATGSIYTIGTAFLEGLLYPVEAVAHGVEGLVVGMDRLGQAVGGQAAQITGDVRRGVEGLGATVTAAREALSENRRAAVESVVVSARAMDDALGRAGDEIQSTFERLAQLGTDAHETADAVRAGTIAIDTQAVALTGMATAAKEASAALASLSDVQIKAKLVIEPPAAGDAEKVAAALESQKAVAFASAEAARAAAAESAAERIRIAAEAEQAAMERRAEVAQRTGTAIGESLAIAVTAQRDATRAIIATIVRETQARITAAIAQSVLLNATPGGQAFGAALVAAIGVAAGQLAQIGGGGGGRGGGGGAPQQVINVTVTGGGSGDDDFIRRVTDAVATGARRGAMA